MTQIDETKPYIKYARDVLSGKIASGKYLYKACQRYIDWFSRDDLYFDYEDIEKKTRFINKMKHYQGAFFGKSFELMPWESWVLSNIWCWKWVADNTNVTNRVLITMARKNAKTALCAAISLCHVWFDEHGAEVDFIANSTSQASIAMDHTLHFAKSLDTKSKYFHRYRGTIKIPRTDSIIQVQSADATTKDGFNSSLFIQDEFNSAKDWSLYNVFISSMGMRRNPCAIVISSAGFLLHGYPLYDYCKTCQSILDGLSEDDTQFSAIYQMDDNDDWQDENNWIKANPSLGVTVTKKYLRSQVNMAKNQPSQEVGVKTKNFNCWCQSAEVWLPDNLIMEHSQNIDLSMFKGDVFAYAGIDLASVSDISAFSILVPYEDKLYFKSWYFLPESQLTDSINAEQYKEWKRQGALIITNGNVQDYQYIENKVAEINGKIVLDKIAIDRWNAVQVQIDLTEMGLPIEPFSQALGNFNIPTKEFERRLKMGDIIIDNNPVTRWMFQNVTLKFDANENCKPTKGDSVSKKIDGVISMLQALGIMLYQPQYSNEILQLYT